MATKDFLMKENNGSGWNDLHPKTTMAQVIGLETKMMDVESVAKGASRAKVFDTVAALDAWIAVAANKATLQIGDNLYVKEIGVPDYWWDGTAKVELETAKVSLANATSTTDGLMSKADFTKLAGVATGANNYVHPTTAGNKHVPSGGASGQILRWSADGTAVWGAENDTSYSVATTTADGLMSKTDKARLDALPTITVGSTAPASPKTGDIWYDTNN